MKHLTHLNCTLKELQGHLDLFANQKEHHNLKTETANHNNSTNTNLGRKMKVISSQQSVQLMI